MGIRLVEESSAGFIAGRKLFAAMPAKANVVDTAVTATIKVNTSILYFMTPFLLFYVLELSVFHSALMYIQ
jgi:hypothetical protein